MTAICSLLPHGANISCCLRIGKAQENGAKDSKVSIVSYSEAAAAKVKFQTWDKIKSGTSSRLCWRPQLFPVKSGLMVKRRYIKWRLYCGRRACRLQQRLIKLVTPLCMYMQWTSSGVQLTHVEWAHAEALCHCTVQGCPRGVMGVRMHEVSTKMASHLELLTCSARAVASVVKRYLLVSRHRMGS